jgi:hypothetical protein
VNSEAWQKKKTRKMISRSPFVSRCVAEKSELEQKIQKGGLGSGMACLVYISVPSVLGKHGAVQLRHSLD